MDPRERHRQQVEYFRRAERWLVRTAKWMQRYRTKRTGVLSIDRPDIVNARTLGLAKEFLARQGIPWTYSRRRQRKRRFAEYILDAPNQPRMLQIHNAFREEQRPSLRMRIEIDGTSDRCVLQYAGFSLYSGRLRTGDASPEADIGVVLDQVRRILAEELVLLRSVRWDEIGHGSGLFPVTSDVLVESANLEPPPGRAKLDGAAEAIIYTWSGQGDQQMIAPRYEEALRRFR